MENYRVFRVYLVRLAKGECEKLYLLARLRQKIEHGRAFTKADLAILKLRDEIRQCNVD